MKMPRALLKSHMTGVPGTLNSENPRTFFRNLNQVIVKKGIARHKSQRERDSAYDISECKFPNIPEGTRDSHDKFLGPMHMSTYLSGHEAMLQNFPEQTS
jgi:hypothetical protein